MADALLKPGDKVFGTAILETQGYGDSAASKFDFAYQGDLLIGLVDGFGEFSINGVSENLAYDGVVNVGNLGPNIDLTFSGSGVFVVGGAVPEPSTWAMMLLGFAGLGFTGYRKPRLNRGVATLGGVAGRPSPKTASTARCSDSHRSEGFTAPSPPQEPRPHGPALSPCARSWLCGRRGR